MECIEYPKTLSSQPTSANQGFAHLIIDQGFAHLILEFVAIWANLKPGAVLKKRSELAPRLPLRASVKVVQGDPVPSRHKEIHSRGQRQGNTEHALTLRYQSHLTSTEVP